MTAADLHPDTGLPRPGTCCGVCPPIAGGGWDCTCPGLPGCPANARAEAVRIIDSSVPDDVPGYRIRYAEKAADALIERGLLAAGRAETTTATDEDMTTRLAAAEAELDRLCDGGRFTMSIPAREGYDSDLLIQAALSDLRGLLATARTRPTREQIAAVVHHVGWEVPEGYEDNLDPENCATCRDSLNTADAVLALLADQPDPADVWDQGYAAGKNDLRDGTPFRTFNPHRGGAR